MESAAWINNFLGWAWERHHNVLSGIRPHQRKPRVRARAMGMEAEQGAGVPVVGAGHRDLTPARGLLRLWVARRIIDGAVAEPALPWHDGRERGKRMNRWQIPTSGRRARGARP